MNEHVLHKDNFDQYVKEVVSFLLIKNKFHYETALLKEYNVKTMAELMDSTPDKFFGAGRRRAKREDDFENTWYDIGEYYIITPGDFMYDLFFIYTLRNLDILQTDEFLNYQQEKYFENEIEKFKRFIHLAIRKHGKILLTAGQSETITEWINILTPQLELSGTNTAERKRGKLKREAGDHMTALNLQQTAMLIHFLQESKIILKDEYLNKTQAGQAFSILTAYSADALRLELNSEKFNLSKENIAELQNIVTRLGIAIKNGIQKK